MPAFTSTFLFSRTDATSNVIVATYGAFAGKDDVGVVAAPACPREEGTARAINPVATSRELIPKFNFGRA
jgi:hypothetical protein